MRIHALQHVSFEHLANIETWSTAKGHSITKTLLYEEARFPSVNELDWLIVLGGPMSVNDEAQYPWLAEEKRFLEEAISKHTLVLGICLGAQLIANVAGARVYRARHKEVGWHPVFLTEEARTSDVFKTLPDKFTAFHWHGETFDLPAGFTHVAYSEASLNQAFENADGHVIGLQFHLECSLESIRSLIKNCSGDLAPATYVQTSEEMLSRNGEIARVNSLMTHLLNKIETKAGNRTP